MNMKKTLFGGLLLLSMSLGFSSPTNAQVYVFDDSLLPDVGASNQTVDIQAVDLDADGDLDLILANEFQVNSVLLNDGTGFFLNGSGILPPIIHDTDDLVIADFDQDGDPDVILVSEDNFGHEYYVNQGNLSFTSGEILPFSKGTAVIAEDLNGDQFPDLLIGNLYSQNIIMMNDGLGNFINETPERFPEFNDGTYDLRLFDADGDEDLDLFVANQDGNKLLVNDGEGFFMDETASRLPQGIEMDTRKVSVGDVDDDGDLDLFLANVEFTLGSNPQNRIYQNDGSGVFTDVTSTHFPTLNDQTTEGVFYDFDEDGDLDLLLSNVLHNPLLIYRNDGTGTFTDSTDDLLGGQDFSLDSWGLVVEDFNGDNFGDIYICNRTGKDALLIGDKEALLSSTNAPDLATRIAVYPQPASDQVTIDLSALGQTVEPPLFSLYNLAGQKVDHLIPTQRASGSYHFDLKSQEGQQFYFVHITLTDYTMVKKLLIQR
ncbi:MAG: T9SS type A sorting domain-containing protein [Bacteroidota bacterium]